jgi:hypothetical protein
VYYEVVLGSTIIKGLHLKEESLAEPVSDRGKAPRSSRQESSTANLPLFNGYRVACGDKGGTGLCLRRLNVSDATRE